MYFIHNQFLYNSENVQNMILLYIPKLKAKRCSSVIGSQNNTRCADRGGLD
uniref:Uncharacterized protein n=1 Tax=Anguilla anguilla TaxID=7936 RepID=A0A0E9TXB1_ANGAN